MKLNEIRDNPGAVKKRKRVGRGIGSGTGKQAGRGGKGQTARSGYAASGFEGGQMPLHRRLPKRGFKNISRKTFAEITLGRLQTAIDDKKLDSSKTVDTAALIDSGLIRRAKDGVRLLGTGALKAKVNLVVTGVTQAARAAVEKAGGSVTLLTKETAVKKAAK